MEIIPREINILGIYIPPLLLAGILAIFTSYLLIMLLTRLRITRYFYHVMLVYVSLTIIMSLFFEKLILLFY